MSVDEYCADGNVDLFYKGLKVNMLKHKTNDTVIRKLAFKTIAANLILPNDNPTKQGHFRKGPINTRRDPKESFFGFMWRSMLDGLTTAIIGFDQHKDEPHNIVTSITKSLAGPKGGTEKKAVNTDKQKPEHRSPRIK